jgi:peptide/nickel transport system substrate-binding protein
MINAREIKKSLILKFLFLFGLLASALMACGNSSGSSGKKGNATAKASENETLINRLGSEPDTLNRLTSNDAYSSQINGYIFDDLIERDNSTLEFKPKLAESWEISEDKLTYTFKLRKGVKWHDGKPFTADDVVFSFQKIMDKTVLAPHLRVYYQEIKSAEKIDDYTVRFIYARPYFKALEFVGGIPIIPKHIYQAGQNFNEHPSNRHPIGNGPYRFVEWKTNQKIVLSRNEDYWDQAHLPAIKKIFFKIISDDTVGFEALKKGDLDLTSLRPIQYVRMTDSAEFKERFVKHQYYTPNYSFIGWNLRRPYFADKKVRKALTILINRQDIVAKLRFGLDKLVSGPFWFQGYENDPNIQALPFDISQAKQLLEEAGWKDSDGDGILDKIIDGKKTAFRFTFLLPQRDFSKQLAGIVQKDFSEAGIHVDIQISEWAAFTKRLNSRDFDAVSLAWSFGLDQDPYQVWHSSQAESGSNFIGFKNAEADKILEEARQVFDKAQRAQLYHRFHQIVHEEQPYTFFI